jgi:hypothetical protein
VGKGKKSAVVISGKNRKRKKRNRGKCEGVKRIGLVWNMVFGQDI